MLLDLYHTVMDFLFDLLFASDPINLFGFELPTWQLAQFILIYLMVSSVMKIIARRKQTQSAAPQE